MSAPFLNNPNQVFDFSIDTSSAEARDDGVRAVCVGVVEGWAAAAKADIAVDAIGGGITNELFRATWQGRSALVRIYGANTELLIDRELDNAMFAELSRRGFAPTYHGRFTNGRIEGWVDARPLEPLEMGHTEPADYQALIARELARLHGQRDMPTGPEGDAKCLWTMLADWGAQATAVRFPEDARQAARLAALDVPAVVAQAQWLEQALSQPPPGVAADSEAWRYCRDSVFSHNDLLSGNVLSVDDGRRVQVIDYEYSSHNVRAFDVANHFCEYAGFAFDLDSDYPKRPAQLRFFDQYLRAENAELHARLEAAGQLAGFYDDMYAIVNRFALGSHLFWGLWAVLQARHSPIDFDFLEYAEQRFGAYYKQKAELFSSSGGGAAGGACCACPRWRQAAVVVGVAAVAVGVFVWARRRR